MSSPVIAEDAWDPYEKEKKRGETMKISILAFNLTIDKTNQSLQEQLLQQVKLHNMAPYYRDLCTHFGYAVDEALFNQMKLENDKVIAEKNNRMEEMKKNGSEDDILDLLLSLAHYYYEIGDIKNAVDKYKACMEYKMSQNMKMDIWMYILDAYLFNQNIQEYKESLKSIQKLVDESGDWEHRNRLNIYLGIRAMIAKDFAKVADLYTKAIPTFTSFSVFSLNDLVKYAIVSAIMYLPRRDIKKYLVEVSDVEMALLEMPVLKQLLASYDECRYHVFFESLLQLEGVLKSDPYLRQHSSFIIGNLRLKAYQQFLDSYKRCTLQSMAESFGVSTAFINSELARFISDGQIHAKIDRMNDTVETQSVTSLNSLYDQILVSGTLLMNRVQTVAKKLDV